MDYILDQARKFLISFLEGQECSYENIHPWRMDWRFVVHHSFRVERYAVKIMQAEARFTADEVLTVRLACILHDIGRMIKRENHAFRGSEIIRQWLGQNPELARAVPDHKSLLQLISEHSDKSSREDQPLLAILKDADTLDEIGVMSIFMASNHLDRESSFFFHDLLARVKGYEIEFCERKMKILNTEAAREILQGKKRFIENFICQLENELLGTENIAEMMKETLFS